MSFIFLRATPLSDVNGRIGYVTDPIRQEHLVATYDSTGDPNFWHELALHCQKAARHSKSKKACEGREWIGAIPHVYAEKYKGKEEQLAQKISVLFKKITGTENSVAIHWNKNMTNFHFHIVVAENEEVNEISYGEIASRNMYFDNMGDRTTKSKALDPVTKELLPGYSFVKKGTRREFVKRFGPKKGLHQKCITKELKQKLADFYNEDILQDEFHEVFPSDSLLIPQIHVGKGRTKHEKEVQEANNLILEYNRNVYEWCDTAQYLSEEEIEVEKNWLFENKKIDTLKSNQSSESNGWHRWLMKLKEALNKLKHHIQELHEELEGGLSYEPQKSLVMNENENDEVKQSGNYASDENALDSSLDDVIDYYEQERDIINSFEDEKEEYIEEELEENEDELDM